MSDSTYLSVVVTTRNDDHGGDPLKRLQAFVNCFDEQSRRTGLDAEVIIVEWNPPAERPRVSSLLRLPDPPFCTYRFIEVPSELHQRLRYADVLPLFQMIAKNVGIRRARGRFVLATNIDIIFSNELVEYLAAGRLQAGRSYRVDRHSIEPAFPVDGSLEEQMAYCAGHQLHVLQCDGMQLVDRRGRVAAFDRDVVDPPVVTLGSGWHIREGDTTSGFARWAGEEARLVVDRSASSGLSRDAVLDLEIEPHPYQPDSWVDLEVSDGARVLARQRIPQTRRLHYALDDDVARHDIVLRALGMSSGAQEWLPLFERRESLQYRLRSARLRTVPLLSAPLHDYDMGRWRRSTLRSGLSVDRTPEGLEIRVDDHNHARCVMYGPLQPEAGARHDFVLEYSCDEGGARFGLFDQARGRWLPSEVLEAHRHGRRTVVVSCDLERGQTCWLTVANDLPRGEGATRVVLHGLRGSVPESRLRPRLDAAALAHAIRGRTDRALRLSAAVVRRSWRALTTLALWIGARLGVVWAAPPEPEDAASRKADARRLQELANLVRFLQQHRPVNLHQNGCGDFQLMAREHWSALRGYPEFEMFSMNIDGLFGLMAHAAGVEEEALDAPLTIYHLEHEKGSGWTPEGEALLLRRIAESGITWLENETVQILGTYMRWLRRPMIFNGSGWGLADATLAETVRAPASREAAPSHTA